MREENKTQAQLIRKDVMTFLNLPRYLESISYDDRYAGISGIRYQDIKESLQNMTDEEDSSKRKYTDGAIVGALNTIAKRNPYIKRIKTEKGTYFVDFSNKIGKWDKLQDDLFSEEVKVKSKEFDNHLQSVIDDISDLLQNIQSKNLNKNLNQDVEVQLEKDKLFLVREKLEDATRIWRNYAHDNEYTKGG